MGTRGSLIPSLPDLFNVAREKRGSLVSNVTHVTSQVQGCPMVISVRGPDTTLHLFNPRTHSLWLLCTGVLESQERKKNMPLSIPKWLTAEVLFTRTVHYSTFSDRYYCIATGHESPTRKSCHVKMQISM